MQNPSLGCQSVVLSIIHLLHKGTQNIFELGKDCPIMLSSKCVLHNKQRGRDKNHLVDAVIV